MARPQAGASTPTPAPPAARSAAPARTELPGIDRWFEAAQLHSALRGAASSEDVPTLTTGIMLLTSALRDPVNRQAWHAIARPLPTAHEAVAQGIEELLRIPVTQPMGLMTLTGQLKLHRSPEALVAVCGAWADALQSLCRAGKLPA